MGETEEGLFYPHSEMEHHDYYHREVRFLWPRKPTPGGRVLMTVLWLQLDGLWECVGLRVDIPRGPLRQLRRSDLDTIRMGDLLEHAAGLLKKELEYAPAEVEVLTLEYDANGEVVTNVTSRPNADVAPESMPKRPGHPPLPDATLQEVARIYDEAYHDYRDPAEAVQERFRLKTKSTASSWIFKARKKGLLPRAERGRVRGHGLRKPREEK